MQARYTVFLKTLMDLPIEKERLDKALSTYPLYAKKSMEEYIPSIVPTREELNKKLLNAYKYREIGFETVGRFLDELEIAMNEIMPKYNQLFFSADQDYNILFNVDYQRTTTTNRTGTASNESGGTSTTTTTASDSSSATTNGENDSKNISSKTPQNDLSITAANIDNVSYADEVSWNKTNNNDSTSTTGSSESTSTNTGTSSGTATNEEDEQVLETTKGNFGVMATQDLISKYRDLIVNIEQQIINDERISELFMRVF